MKNCNFRHSAYTGLPV